MQPNPDKLVAAKRKSRIVGELTIENIQSFEDGENSSIRFF